MYLGITSIQRNRAPWIMEWIAFHYLVGFRKFYMYLHRCSDNTEAILNDLKKHFDIEIYKVDKNLEAPQLGCYQESYKMHGNNVSWMAFIDGDEFLFPTTKDSMIKALDEFSEKQLSAIGVYWSNFGSSGHIKEPDGLIIENYKYRARRNFIPNRHIKSLVRGGQGKYVIPSDPHFFRTSLGTFDEKMRPITYGLTNYKPSYAKFCVNHYATQSQSFFTNFKSRYSTPDGGGIPDKLFWKDHNRNAVLDHSMDKFVKPLKKILDSIK
jgi:hypothetical protein